MKKQSERGTSARLTQFLRGSYGPPTPEMAKCCCDCGGASWEVQDEMAVGKDRQRLNDDSLQVLFQRLLKHRSSKNQNGFNSPTSLWPSVVDLQSLSYFITFVQINTTVQCQIVWNER